MMKINNLEAKKWVVAISGGADSMALLDMCVKNNIDVVAAHVNYKKRDTADRDMNGVKRYCELHNIPCFIHIVKMYQEGINFQAQAREIRYQFFKEVRSKVNANGVLVGHHFDDVIETYLMQKQRGSIPEFYGIREEMMMDDLLVKRILLDYTKQDLIDYCLDNQLEYFDDESNFEDDYTRNKIRHDVVELMSQSDKEKMRDEIKKENQKKEIINKEILEKGYKIQALNEIELFLRLSFETQKYVLRNWISETTGLSNMSEKNIETLISMICNKKQNFRHNINDYYYLLVEYGYFTLYEDKNEDFEYTYQQVEFTSTPFFRVVKEGKVIEGITLGEKDFPIQIRNARPNDKIKLRMGTKKVSRFFIDNKISHNERKKWPVVVNAEGNVIFVHKIGCDIEHYSNNYTLFVVK